MSSFWEGSRRQYGDAALPPAARKALGLPDATPSPLNDSKPSGADLAPPATGSKAPTASPLPGGRRRPTNTLRVALDEAHREQLADMADEAGLSEADTAKSIITHVLDDDASEHGR
ncbi:hypothetical protein [Breoghania sp.]|uniref:hypothetical protein n=1 Tax=Breoghania sp. TaxID=2065378 RepID=UPI002AA75BB1|nr:hypothetical protein [Breoghania sp.]